MLHNCNILLYRYRFFFVFVFSFYKALFFLFFFVHFLIHSLCIGVFMGTFINAFNLACENQTSWLSINNEVRKHWQSQLNNQLLSSCPLTAAQYDEVIHSSMKNSSNHMNKK